MGGVTLLIGLALVAVGVGGYLGTGRSSATALIPAAFGVVLVLLGAAATRPRWRKHAMHGAVIVAVLGIVGPVMRMIKAVGGPEFEVSTPFILQGVMVALCAALVVLSVRSFIVARRGAGGDA